MNKLLTQLKALFRTFALLLLTAGLGCMLVGLSVGYYGHVGDPDRGWLKCAGIGLACIVAAIALDRAIALINDAPGESRRGFPVEVTSDVSRTIEPPAAARGPQSRP